MDFKTFLGFIYQVLTFVIDEQPAGLPSRFLTFKVIIGSQRLDGNWAWSMPHGPNLNPNRTDRIHDTFFDPLAP